MYLPERVFTLFLLCIRTSNIVPEDRYHKIFVEVNEVDEYREGPWVYIARNVHRHEKHSKENVLSSKPLSPGEKFFNSLITI